MMMKWLGGGRIIFILIGLVAGLFLYFYARLYVTERELEKTKINYEIAKEANKNNEAVNEEIRVRHESEIKALTKQNEETKKLNKRVENAKQNIHKSVGEGDDIRLFNDTVSRLWGEAASHHTN